MHLKSMHLFYKEKLIEIINFRNIQKLKLLYNNNGLPKNSWLMVDSKKPTTANYQK